MRYFGAFEAKTHFSELLKSVIHGEKCVITKHGVKVAVVIPYPIEEEETPIDEAIETIKKLRKGVKLDRLTIKKMMNKGRR